MAEVGRTAVWIALVCGAASALGAVAGRAAWAARAVAWSLGVAVAAIGLATLALVHALVTDDFSLTYVADFSREGIGASYRIAALWGGMAGSLLWFATLLGVAGLVAAWRAGAGADGNGDRDGADDPRRASPMAMQGVTGGLVAVLAGLVLAFADPFRRLEVPAISGAGLVPILEHPAMLYHPPLLYVGLATLVGPFALTVAALTRGSGRLDDTWAATVRTWLLVPWTLLAVGMVAGAHWAYVELGWGGYWAWDPVENTALLPWLAVTLFLHAARRASLGGPSRAAGRVVLAGLACLPFVLALLGALLTRSGATSSVHAFAESQAIGRALGGVVAVVAVGVVVLLVRSARTPSPVTAEPGGDGRRPVRPVRHGRHGQLRARLSVPDLLAGHLAVVGAVLAVVLAGTVWPLWTDLAGGDGIAIEGRYFASYAGTLAVAGLLLLCALAATQSRGGTADRAMTGAVLSGGGAALAALIAAGGDVDGPAVVLAVLGGVVVGTGLLAATRRTSGRIGAHLAHAGLGLLLVGIAGTTTGETTTVPIAPGETVEVAGRRVSFDGVAVADGPVDGSSAVVADVEVDGRRLSPSIVAFPERSVLLPETSLVSGPLADVQVALRDARDDGSALLDIGVHPLQVLVWWGGLVLVAGGALAGWEATARRGPEGHSSRSDDRVDAIARQA